MKRSTVSERNPEATPNAESRNLGSRTLKKHNEKDADSTFMFVSCLQVYIYHCFAAGI